MERLYNALTDKWKRYRFSLSKIEIKCVSGNNNPLFIRLESMYENTCIGLIKVAFMNRHYLGDIPARDAVAQALRERNWNQCHEQLVYLSDIQVDPRFRNYGVGRVLFNKAITEACSKIEGKTILLGIARTEQSRYFLSRCGMDVIKSSSFASIMIAQIDRSAPGVIVRNDPDEREELVA